MDACFPQTELKIPPKESVPPEVNGSFVIDFTQLVQDSTLRWFFCKLPLAVLMIQCGKCFNELGIVQGFHGVSN